VIAIFTEKMLNNERPIIYGDGSQTRDYTFVGDIVNANVIATKGNHNGIYNIGTGIETSVQQIFDALKNAIGCDLEPIYAKERLGEIQRICLAADKAREELGWKPEDDIKSGFAKTVEFYRQQFNQ
jgi:UDP-glucose 4-epimerase